MDRMGSSRVYDYSGLWCRPHSEREQLQILAQFKKLAEEKFEASEKALREVREDSMKRTPDNLDELVIDRYDQLIFEYTQKHNLRPFDVKNGITLFRESEIKEVIMEIEERCKLSNQKLRKLLNRHDRKARDKDGKRDLYKCVLTV